METVPCKYDGCDRTTYPDHYLGYCAHHEKLWNNALDDHHDDLAGDDE